MKSEEKWECEVIGGPVKVTFDGLEGTLELLKRDSTHYAVVFWFESESAPKELIGDVLERPSSEAEAVSLYLAYQFNPTRQLRLPGM